MERNGNLLDAKAYHLGVLQREAEGTTGLGQGIAFPHAKSEAVARPGISVQIVPGGVAFEALDGQPVRMIFLIAAPANQPDMHLKILARLSALLLEESFRHRLMTADSSEKLLALLDDADAARIVRGR